MNTYLLVKLDESGLKLILDVLAREMIWELVVRVGLACVGLLGSVVGRGSIRNGPHGGRLVLDVLNFAQGNVRRLFVANDCRVVQGSIPRQFREV